MTIRLTLSGLFLLIFTGLQAQHQDSTKTEDPYEKAYQERIKKEYLFGVYIPKDLADCFIQLNRLVDSPSRNKFKNMPEEAAATKLHFSLGRWIIYNWGFYGGSRLSNYLSKLGISNPDDMARFIIITYHRNLNKQKLEVKSLIEFFKKKKEKAIEERKKRGKVIHEERRKREN